MTQTIEEIKGLSVNYKGYQIWVDAHYETTADYANRQPTEWRWQAYNMRNFQLLNCDSSCSPTTALAAAKKWVDNLKA